MEHVKIFHQGDDGGMGSVKECWRQERDYTKMLQSFFFFHRGVVVPCQGESDQKKNKMLHKSGGARCEFPFAEGSCRCTRAWVWPFAARGHTQKKDDGCVHEFRESGLSDARGRGQTWSFQ